MRLATRVRPLASVFAPRLHRRHCQSKIEDAVKVTVGHLREHPTLIEEVLRQADDDTRRVLLASSAQHVFQEADCDGDGTISRSERIQYTRRYPDPSDAASVTSPPSADEPTRWQLTKLMLRISVPFVGFGFLDNAIMIVAGDQIDALLGASLGLSAMAAAGLGNLVSDVIGIQASGTIERSADRVGLPDPQLSRSQMAGSSAVVASSLASMLGISLGCILGLVPLLFMEGEEDRSMRKTFESIDLNGNGRISVGELENVSGTLHATSNSPVLQTQFSPTEYLDHCTRHDSYSCNPPCDHIQALHKMGLPLSRSTVQQIFDEIDADRTRSLDLQEFKTLARKWRSLENA